MSAPLIIAVPAKGRLQENAENFFARAGLRLVKPRGARDYRGTIDGMDGVEIAYLSAAEITAQLSQGAAHMGVTGEDLVREMIPQADERVILLEGLGFGFANVVVAVPQAWIDVRSMADLDDVATAFRLRHNRKMRVATKYVNLTRDFFAKNGIADYRIVESLGATEGAPAAGTAELIVDITTTGNTLTANALKVIDDGVMLRSQANLVAARGADWKNGALDTARAILDRIAGAGSRACLPRDAHALQRLRRYSAGAGTRNLRHRDAVRRPHLLRHADVALPARSGVRAGGLPARQGRAGDLGLRDRLCVHAGQPAVRKTEGGVVGSGAFSFRIKSALATTSVDLSGRSRVFPTSASIFIAQVGNIRLVQERSAHEVCRVRGHELSRDMSPLTLTLSPQGRGNRPSATRLLPSK